MTGRGSRTAGNRQDPGAVALRPRRRERDCSDRVFGVLFEGVSGHRGQEGVRGHGRSDAAVPANVAADFVLVQAALVLRGREGLLNGPSGAGQADQFGDVCLREGEGEAVGDLLKAGRAVTGRPSRRLRTESALRWRPGRRSELSVRTVAFRTPVAAATSLIPPCQRPNLRLCGQPTFALLQVWQQRLKPRSHDPLGSLRAPNTTAAIPGVGSRDVYRGKSLASPNSPCQMGGADRPRRIDHERR